MELLLQKKTVHLNVCGTYSATSLVDSQQAELRKSGESGIIQTVSC